VTPVPADVQYSKQIKKDIDDHFQNTFKGKVDAILIAADPLFNDHRKEVLAAVKANGSLPTMYQWREFPDDGGLISFGTKLMQSYKMAAGYVAIILKWIDTTTARQILPVLSPHVELVINTNSGYAIPPLLFVRADDIVNKAFRVRGPRARP
jgi:putative ABC transport system substrate-binding protein